MRPGIGHRIKHPESGIEGTVIDVHVNPACEMRTLVIRWDTNEVEEMEEIEFGPLDGEMGSPR